MTLTHFEAELKQLREGLLEMMYLVMQQLEKARGALLNFDKELAEDVNHHENKVNSLELSLTRDCENILALFNPVAVDLRFVLASLKIITCLERIGDHAHDIARGVIDLKLPYDEKLLNDVNFSEMYAMAASMLEDAIEALEQEDTKLARKIFKKDSFLNENIRKSRPVIGKYICQNPERAEDLLRLYTYIEKLERVGDQCKNIAEEIIFYIEAKVLKHRKTLREAARRKRE